jgi:integrase
MNFDARIAKALAPGKHITFDSYPGLRLSASEKWRTWTYRYKSPVDGLMRQVAIGRWPGMSFPAAIVAWESLKSQRDAGGDPALNAKNQRQNERAAAAKQKEQQLQNAYTVRRLCDDYLDGYIDRNRAAKGADAVRRMFDAKLGDFGNVPAASVTRAQAFDLVSDYASTAPVQAMRLRCELGAAWDYAIDAGRIPETTPNWWRMIMRGRIRSEGKFIDGIRVGTAKRVLNDDEVGELIAWLPNFTLIIADALTLYLWTAARGAEITAMTGAEIANESGQIWWTIPKAKTKNARHAGATDQRVPLFGKGLEVVLRRKRLYGDGFLFPAQSENGHIKQKFISEQVYYRQPYCKIRPEYVRARLSISHWAPHDLRRTSRTLLAKLGCPDAVGEMILGHMLPGVMGTYNRHQYDDEKQEWLFKLSSHLDELMQRFYVGKL